MRFILDIYSKYLNLEFDNKLLEVQKYVSDMLNVFFLFIGVE